MLMIRFPFCKVHFYFESNDKKAINLIKKLFVHYIVENNIDVLNEAIHIIIRNDEDKIFIECVNYDRFVVKSYTEMLGIISYFTNLKDFFDTSKYYFLHCSLTILNNNAIILLGPTGNGKSTLTYGLCEHGFHYVTDDLLYYNKKTNNIYGFIKPMFIRSIDCILEYNWTKNIQELRKNIIFYPDKSIRNYYLPKNIGLYKKNTYLNIYVLNRQENKNFSIEYNMNREEKINESIVNTYVPSNLADNLKWSIILSNYSFSKIYYNDGRDVINFFLNKYQ